MLQKVIFDADVLFPAATSLRAGKLSCLYAMGKLRYIRYQQTEIIRMIYSAVRDEAWGTLTFTIEDEALIHSEKEFSIRYTAVYRKDGIPVYKAYHSISGTADSRIIFSMKGFALAGFKKNRIGVCVHHSISACIGREATITRPDKTKYSASFPVDISPSQPFLQVRHMEWTNSGGIQTQLAFSGDIFETEDQRNWSDSSFKTYSTPLQLPFPVSLIAGDAMEQEVVLTASGPLQDLPVQEQIISEEKLTFPKIGYARGAYQLPLTTLVIDRLKEIPFHHYQVEICLFEKGWQDILTAALNEARLLQTRLVLRTFFSADFYVEANELISILHPSQELLHSICLLRNDQAVTPQELLQQLYTLLKNAFPDVQVGYGAGAAFVDLNRQRPDKLPFDFVSFPLHPQVHATDSRSLMENLENQSDMISTAKQFASGKQVAVSVTLKDTHDATGPDARQYSDFAAVWTLLSLQQLAEADTITYFEVYGPAGLLQGPSKHNKDLALHLSSLYNALTMIKTFNPCCIIRRRTGTNILLDGLLLENALGERLFFKVPEEFKASSLPFA